MPSPTPSFDRQARRVLLFSELTRADLNQGLRGGSLQRIRPGAYLVTDPATGGTARSSDAVGH